MNIPSGHLPSARGNYAVKQRSQKFATDDDYPECRRPRFAVQRPSGLVFGDPPLVPEKDYQPHIAEKYQYLLHQDWFKAFMRFTKTAYHLVEKNWQEPYFDAARRPTRRAKYFLALGLGNWQSNRTMVQIIGLEFMRRIDSHMIASEFASYDRVSTNAMNWSLETTMDMSAHNYNLEYAALRPLFAHPLRIYLPTSGPSVLHGVLSSALQFGPLGLHHLHLILLPSSYLNCQSILAETPVEQQHRYHAKVAVSYCQKIPIDEKELHRYHHPDMEALLGSLNDCIIHLFWRLEDSQNAYREARATYGIT